MRTIVRVLPRLVMLGVAGGALLVLAERAQDAHAQVPEPPAVPGSPSIPSVDLPPVTTPPPTTPPAPAPPPVPSPSLPPAPTVPPAPALPPSVPLPAMPALPGSPHPGPGGGAPHPTRADPAAYLSPGADHASRRAGLLAEARVYASTLLRDPLLRPD